MNTSYLSHNHAVYRNVSNPILQLVIYSTLYYAHLLKDVLQHVRSSQVGGKEHKIKKSWQARSLEV